MSPLKISYSSDSITVSLNRPEKRNALDLELMSELTDFFIDLKENLKSFKYILLEGEGKSFCAGADLSWMKNMAQYSYEENLEDSKVLFNLFNSIYSCPLPVIVKAHGHVFGGGLGLLAAADLVVAEENTKFCFSEVKLGLAPAVISSFVVSKCNLAQAEFFMLSAEVFNEQQALNMGLVNTVFEKERFKKITASLESSSQEALVATKKLLKEQRLLKPTDFKDQTISVISKLRVSDEAQNRMNAFLSKQR